VTLGAGNVVRKLGLASLGGAMRCCVLGLSGQGFTQVSLGD